MLGGGLRKKNIVSTPGMISSHDQERVILKSSPANSVERFKLYSKLRSSQTVFWSVGCWSSHAARPDRADKLHANPIPVRMPAPPARTH